jgi:tripartite ATP-independent transporter DctP family solute receptor
LNYPCDKIYISPDQGLFILQEHDNLQCFYFDVELTDQEGLPIEKALLHIFKSDKFNEYSIVINSKGYHPAQISNIQLYPGLISKYCIQMIPSCKCIYTKQSVEDTQDGETSHDEIRDMTLTLGLDSPRGSLATLYAEKFAEEVNTLSSGKMKIEVFTDAALGNDRQMLNTIISEKKPNFIIQTTAHQVNLVPGLAILDMPMVYTDINKLRNTMDNEIFYDKINNIYSSGGYKLLGMADEQFREMTSNLEIQDIEQFGGIKIRTIQNPNHIKFWQLLGAIVIPLPVGEIHSSLVRGYIDAQENPYGNIAAFKFYDVQDYVINTNHLPHFLPLITSNDIFNSFNEQEKKVIEEAAKNATAYTRIKADERLEEVKQTLIDNGMDIVDLPDRTKQDMVKFAATPVYESIRTQVNDDELIDLYLEMSK